MNAITKTLVLAVVVTLGHFGNAPSAYAITISIAEVRGDVAFVKGREAGWKQQIFWENGPDPVTTANGGGNFSFEGVLPAGCPDKCVGMLIAGGDPFEVQLVYPSSEPPGEPPGEPDKKLELKHEILESHGGDSVRAVGFVTDGMEVQVVSGGADARLRYWTLDLNETPVVDWSLPNIIYDIDVLTDDVSGTSIVATGEGGWNGHAGSETLRIWDALGTPLTETQVPIGFVYSVAFSPWGLIAASGFYGDHVMYQTSNLELYDTTATKKKRTRALAFSPDGSILASASTAGIQLRSVPLGCDPGNCQLDLIQTLSHSGSWSFSIAFAPDTPDSIPDSIKMVSGSDSGTTKLWIIENLDTNPTASLLHSVDSGSVYALAWSPDGTRIVAGESGDITVYDSTDLGILFRNVDAHAGRVNDVAFSPDSSRIVSGGADGALKLWMYPAP